MQASQSVKFTIFAYPGLGSARKVHKIVPITKSTNEVNHIQLSFHIQNHPEGYSAPSNIQCPRIPNKVGLPSQRHLGKPKPLCSNVKRLFHHLPSKVKNTFPSLPIPFIPPLSSSHISNLISSINGPNPLRDRSSDRYPHHRVVSNRNAIISRRMRNPTQNPPPSPPIAPWTG